MNLIELLQVVLQGNHVEDECIYENVENLHETYANIRTPTAESLGSLANPNVSRRLKN